MKKKSLTALSIIIFALFIPNTYASSQDSVFSTSDGVASIYKDNIANAREDAINDAIKKTVSGTLEALLSAAQISRNYNIIEENIINKSQQYITNYKVVSEKAIGNIYQVTIQTIIAKSKLKEDLLVLGLLSAQKASLKTLVMLAEEDIKNSRFNFWWKDIDNYEAQGASTKVLEAKLAENDFHVIDIHGGSISSNIPGFYKDEALSIDAISYIGKLYNADLVIYGKAHTLPAKRTSRLSKKSIHAIISLSAIDIHTGQVLLSSENEELTDPAGLKDAFKKATSLLAERMISIIADKLNDSEGGLTTIKMSISGITSYISFMKFQELIQKEAKGVQKIHQRGFSAGKAKLEIEMIGTAQKLADELTMIMYEGFLIDITEITKERIHVKMRTG